jgi:hypothetical protein
VSDEPGRPQVLVEPWPQDGRKWAATTAGGTRPRWRRDGRAVFFLRGGGLMETTLVERGKEVTFSPARAVLDLPGVRDYTPANTTNRLLAVVPTPRTVAPVGRLIVDWMPE